MNFKDFTVLEVLQGGISDVFICSMPKQKEENKEFKIVLKTIQDQFFYDPKVRKAFVMECINWLKLSHIPNILSVFQFDFVNGKPFLFLPYVFPDENGCTTLNDHILRGPIETSLIIKYSFQLSLALSNASKVIPELIHGDLKPDNLFIGNQNLMIADFGLSRTVADNINYLGNERYRAPEAWEGKNNMTTSIDIYAFGLILYQMLTCEHALQPSKNSSWEEAHLYVQPTVPKELTQFSFSQKFFNKLLSLDSDAFEKQIKDLSFTDAEIRMILMELSLLCLRKVPSQRPDNFAQIVNIVKKITELDALLFLGFIGTLFSMANANNSTKEVLMQHGYTQTLETLIKLDFIDLAKKELNKVPKEIFNDHLWHLSGSIHSLTGDDEIALIHLDKAYQEYQKEEQKTMCLIEKGLSLKRLKRYEEAEVLFSDLLQKVPSEQLYNLIVNFATLYMEWKKFKEASDLLENYLRRGNKGGMHLWVNLGRCYVKQNSFENAISSFEKALQLNPSFGGIHVDAAEAFIDGFQNYESAIYHLEAAVNLGHEDSKVFFLLAESYSNLKQFEKADAYFKIIESRIGQPGYQKEYYLFAKSFYFTEQSNYEGALQLLEEALLISPNNSTYLVEKAKRLEYLKKYKPLEDCLNLLIELNPDHQDLKLWLEDVHNMIDPTGKQPTTAEEATIEEITLENFTWVLMVRLKKYLDDCRQNNKHDSLGNLMDSPLEFPQDFYSLSALVTLFKDRGLDIYDCPLSFYFAVVLTNGKGRMDLSVLLLEEAIRCFPEFSDFYFASGLIYQFMSQRQKSQELLKTAAEKGIDVDNPTSYLKIGLGNYCCKK